MLSFGVLLLMACLIAELGIWLIHVGTPKEAEYDQTAEDRMVKYRAWLRGGNKKGKIKFAESCVDEAHSPMVLFNREDSTKVDSVICKLCTDSLPVPASYSCDKCWVIAVDGYLHVDECDSHRETVLT